MTTDSTAPRSARALAGLATLAALGSCSIVPKVALVPRVGQLDVGGDLKIASGPTTASSDAKTLGFMKDSSVFEPRVDLGWGPLDIMASYYDASYAGTGTAQAQIDLGGTTISAGDNVDSSLDIASGNVIATFDFIPTDLVDIGIGIGATYVDFDTRITSLTTTQSVQAAEAFVIPVAAARAAVELGPFQATAHGSGLTGSYGGVDATFVDLDVMLEYAFDRFLGFHGGLVAGYRYIAIDVRYDDQGSEVDANLDFSGPFIGLTLGN